MPRRVVEELRDAEVEQPGLALGRHEHIGRLDVAMDDQLAVRVCDGIDYLLKQPQRGRDTEPAIGHVPIDGGALDVLQCEKRLPRIGDAGIVEPGEPTPVKRYARPTPALPAGLDSVEHSSIARRLACAPRSTRAVTCSPSRR